MDDNLYDEFGNYIGPDVSDEEESEVEEEEYDRDQVDEEDVQPMDVQGMCLIMRSSLYRFRELWFSLLTKGHVIDWRVVGYLIMKKRDILRVIILELDIG